METELIKVEYTVPEKFWKFVSDALADLEAIERNPNYWVDMSTWHRPVDGGVCKVCLAGVVIANRLGVTPHQTCRPSSFEDERLQYALVALDCICQGEVVVAIGLFYNDEKTNKVVDAISVIETVDDTYEYERYYEDPTNFKAWLVKVINVLKEYDI